jgi:hypothetical protein
MKNIWMYWEKPEKTMPEYIKLCIKTVERYKGDLHLRLLDENSVNDFLPDLRPEWMDLKIVHKADYIRTRLVYKYGGLWLDSDIVVIKDIEPIFCFPDDLDYACQTIEVSSGCFLARSGCKFLAKVIEEQDKVVDEGPASIAYTGISNDVMARVSHGYKYYQWDKWTFDQIAGGKVTKLFSKNETIKENVDENAIFFHLCNEAFGPLIKKYLADSRLLTSDMLISKIFRKALVISEG